MNLFETHFLSNNMWQEIQCVRGWSPSNLRLEMVFHFRLGIREETFQILPMLVRFIHFKLLLIQIGFIKRDNFKKKPYTWFDTSINCLLHSDRIQHQAAHPEVTLRHVNLGVVYPESSHKITPFQSGCSDSEWKPCYK